MSCLKEYKTVSKKATIEIIEKKSKFIANVMPVENIDEAVMFISGLKKEFSNASHNCSAFSVGLTVPTHRYSDDGEPPGTAGTPILNALTGEKLCNVVVVVSRFFGGVLLGTGGLVKAYTEATKSALLEAQIVTKKLYSIINLKTSYNLSGKVQFEIINNNHFIKDIQYLEDVSFLVYVQADFEKQFLEQMADITAGQGVSNIIEKKYEIDLNI